MSRYVYFFGGGKSEGRADMKALLGGKGANLCEMTHLGIPVPPGFVITTEACRYFHENGGKFPTGLEEEIDRNLEVLGRTLGAGFGDPERPLLVSVRSGAAVSMPGMMDTVLNLGLNEWTLEGIVRRMNQERFAWDAYRRFVNMFGDVVMGVPHEAFEEILSEVKRSANATLDTELGVDDLKEVVRRYLELYRSRTGGEFPTDPKIQLRRSIEAVFNSWNTERAAKYRKLHNITGLAGTAVNVQAMVFGNMGERSATGVLFTRNPSTGENRLYGEYLMNAQGEDVVAGIRTPHPIADLGEAMPELYREIETICRRLEEHYRDVQDIEFTIQEGTLFLLQTRSGKRTAKAAVKIAVDMVAAGLIDPETAVRRIDERHLEQFLHPTFDPKAARQVIGKGLPASPGAAVGKVVFTAEEAEDLGAKGEKVILVRVETSPEDIGGMHAAQGILTARGGMTSHAAVVARGMGKCCVAGCSDIEIDMRKGCLVGRDGTRIGRGEFLSLDGSSGEVMAGSVATVAPELGADFQTIMKWADEIRSMEVWANADTPEDARTARRLGAQGIGLARTEHMFFEPERIKAVREMILAHSKAERVKALDKLLPMQKSNFFGLFREMDGLPITIRLLDPPLHEFLPVEEEAQREMADELGMTIEQIQAKVAALREFNPMLGHRGCRLGITYPEIYEMQARAIFSAACEAKKAGHTVIPEIMLPLIGNVTEFRFLRERIVRVGEEVFKEHGERFGYHVGTMIEVPRAALVAGEIGAEADFFSFGTNDLTQMTFGFSRDDAGSFIAHYVEHGILPDDPFQTIDTHGVGRIMKLAVQEGRAANPGLKVGICGEHGGDPRSIFFCRGLGMNYVSCSPFRVPVARLAAAQAELEKPEID